MSGTAWLITAGILVLVAIAGTVAAFRRRGLLPSRVRLRQLEERLDRRLGHLEERDERLTRRETTLEAKARTLELREANLIERERALTGAQAEIDDVRIVQRKRLEEIAEYTAEEARQALFEQVEADARHDAYVLIRDIENRAREECARRAREIVATAIQRVAVETTESTATSVVELPDDDLKGRIIGRDGRNIRAFEQVTGVNLVIDDTPEMVLLSSFDPVRRETARLALAALLQDGRIHPASIESAYARAQDEVEQRVIAAGRDAVIEAKVEGVDDDLLRLLGQLQYRTSYGQNVLRHVIETAHLAGLMADELGIDPRLPRRCGLLHDIGKALNHELEGGHAAIGAEIAHRLGEPAAVCHAIEAHHNDVEPRSIEAVLTQAADAISASRPGARRDAHEHYVNRMRRIEELCSSYEGVDKVYAMQAGRDVRVMVHPDAVDDAAAKSLARALAARIEDELAYPGQIAITVIRELRARETAR